MNPTTVLLVLCSLSAVLCQIVVTNPSTNFLAQNDNNVLKLALTVENFDTTYYARHLDPAVNASAFTRQDFQNAGYGSTVYDLFISFLANERAHIAALNTALFERNGTTVGPCTYNYPPTPTVNDFVFWSKMFENVGTAAYDGSINAIYNKTLQQSAATIATVEARQAAFLNTLPVNFPAGLTSMFGINITFPFPYAQDLAFNGTTVYQLIRPYVSCPYTLPINPVIALVIPVSAPAGSPVNPSAYQVSQNDVNTLNFALTLELLEATFYNRYLDDVNFNEAAFIAAGFSAFQRAYIEVVRAHENMHVNTLRQVITSLGFQPVGNCTYNFPVTDVRSFLNVAVLLENTGVSAYDGAINTINDPGLRQTAAQIATVEGRHASFIGRLVNPTQLTPNGAFDQALSPQDVVTAITQPQSNGLPLVSGCPAPALPRVVVINPYSNSTASTTARTTATTTTGGVSGGSGGSGSTTSAASSVAAVMLLSIVLVLVNAL